jgi:hypothetical protein
LGDEIPVGDDAVPGFGVAVGKAHPPVMLGTFVSSDLGQNYMPLAERKAYHRWRIRAAGYQPEAVDPQQGEADLDSGRIHDQAEVATILCEAIEILRGILATVELPDCRE